MEDFKWESGTNILLGIWLVLSPFFYGYGSSGELGGDLLAGSAIALLAAFRTFQRNVGGWADILTAVLGVWVILSPWTLNFSGNEAHTFNNVMVGTIVLAFSLVSRLIRLREPTFSSAEPPEERER